MGTQFDFFDETSRTEHRSLTAVQRANRMLLRSLMAQHGFRNYPMEWWHFTLEDEPFPETVFDFPIE
jgi:D-alanyl-D-alanine dipeptidase